MNTYILISDLCPHPDIDRVEVGIIFQRPKRIVIFSRGGDVKSALNHLHENIQNTSFPFEYSKITTMTLDKFCLFFKNNLPGDEEQREKSMIIDGYTNEQIKEIISKMTGSQK